MKRNTVKRPTNQPWNQYMDLEDSNKDARKILTVIAKVSARGKGNQLNYHDECTFVDI